MRRIFKDPGFLSWVALLLLPVPYLILQHFFDTKVAVAFLGCGCGVTMAFFRVFRTQTLVTEPRPQFSLMQLLVGTMSAGIEVGLCVSFVRSHDMIVVAALFTAMMILPILSAICLVLLR